MGKKTIICQFLPKIEYQIRDSVVLIIDIYSCQTNPDLRLFHKT